MSPHKTMPFSRRGLIQTVAAVFLLALIYLLPKHSYLFFHSFVEILSIVIVWSIFVLMLNTRRFLKTGYFICLGAGFFFVGFFDFFHTLSYRGMGIMPGSEDGNMATQFWIAMRYLLAVSFLLAPVFLRREIRFFPVFAVFSAAAAGLLLAILWKPVFPDCFIPGVGLTPFKIISEYIICIMLLAALLLLYRNRDEFHADVFRYLSRAVVLAVLSELAFTLYKDTTGLFNVLGHFLEALSFLAAYKAFIEQGLIHPHNLVFLDLMRHEAELRSSENEFRALFERSGVGLAQINPATGRFIRVNRKFCGITGYSPEELEAVRFETIVLQETRGANGFFKFLTNEAGRKEYLHKDGHTVWVEETRTVIHGPDGHPLYTMIAVQDITARRQAETALQESEQRYRALFSSMTEGFALHEIICNEQGVPCDYRFLDINPAFEQMTGLSRKKTVGRTHNEILPGDDPRWVREYGEVALTGNPVRFENYSPALERYYDVFAYRPASGQFAVIFRDITELRRMRERVSYLASFPLLNHNPVTEADMEGHICFANPAAQRLFPDIEKLDGKHPWMIDWDGIVRKCSTPDAVMPSREVVVNDRCFHQTMNFVPESRRIRIYGMDITDRKQAEKQIVESEERLRAALLAARAFTFEWFPATDEVRRSEDCGAVLGLGPECTRDTGRNFFEQIHHEDRDGFVKLLHSLVPSAPDYKTEYRYVRADGQIIWLEERGAAVFDGNNNLIRLHGITADITDRVEARRRETEAVAAASAARSAIDTVNAMGEGVVLLKLDGTILNANPAALALAGLRKQDAIGRSMKDILPRLLEGGYLDTAMKALVTVAEKQIPHLPVIMLRRPQGQALYISASVAFIESGQELPATVVLTLKDITALHESTRTLERIFDNSHISIVYLDPQFNFIRVNRIYAAACGKPVDFFPGKNHFDLYPHEENERIFRQVVTGGKPYIVHDKPFEFPDHPERGVTYWDWSLQPIKDEQGKVEALVFCLQDTTERKKALIALEESERKYRELVENANSIIMRITPEHRITFFNEYAQTFFGYSEEEVLGKSVLETITPPVDSAGNDLRKMTEAITARPETYAVNENENVCKNGRRVWISWTNRVVRDEQGRLKEILCVGTDATARKQIQDENRLYQERLRRLAEQLAASEEEERWQISRYIHDTIIQNLSLSSMKLGALQNPQAEAGAGQKAADIQTTRQLVDEAIAECRTVMSELTPPLLYELGLTSALIELANHLRERHGIQVTVEKNGELSQMDNTLRGLLFQSARELVMNALKHANCLGICISVGQTGGILQICVRDDGRGFDSSLLFTHRGTGPGGFGLFSVRERVENLGGRLEILSGPGRGTEARISIPVSADESGKTVS